VWLNPPYSDIGGWLAKAVHETIVEGRADLVAALVPPRTDQAWWHEWVLPWPHYLHWFRWRIRFISPSGAPALSPREPSVLIVYVRSANVAWRLRGGGR
jgi:hypothetical protein